MAVGPGRYPLRYDGIKGERTKYWDSKQFRPTEVKPGDVVELGGLELDGYGFPEVLIGSQLHVVCREEDVCGVVT